MNFIMPSQACFVDGDFARFFNSSLSPASSSWRDAITGSESTAVGLDGALNDLEVGTCSK